MAAREAILFDPGDLSAPKGSMAWVRAVHIEAKQALNDAATTKEHVMSWVNALRENNHFRLLQDANGRQFMLWEEFCTTAQPIGLGYSPDAIEAIIAERASIEALAETTRKARDEKGGRPEKHSDKLGLPTGSTNAKRLTARIARDRPDILVRMKAGEFKSVRAAAREAGLVRDPSPLDLLRKAWKKASADERIAFKRWITEP